MSADIRPDHIMIVEPRPRADVWVRDGEVVSLIIANAPEHLGVDPDKSLLIFPPEFEVIVHEVRP